MTTARFPALVHFPVLKRIFALISNWQACIGKCCGTYLHKFVENPAALLASDNSVLLATEQSEEMMIGTGFISEPPSSRHSIDNLLSLTRATFVLVSEEMLCVFLKQCKFLLNPPLDHRKNCMQINRSKCIKCVATNSLTCKKQEKICQSNYIFISLVLGEKVLSANFCYLLNTCNYFILIISNNLQKTFAYGCIDENYNEVG